MRRPRSRSLRQLYNAYVGSDERKRFQLEQERFNAEIAEAIYAMRKKAGLTQAELARRIRTTPSVISRLENADYDGHSLKMLIRVLAALGQGLELSTFSLAPGRVARPRPIAAIPAVRRGAVRPNGARRAAGETR